MSAEHGKLEMQCALAVSGALDEGEFAALCGHVQACSECRRALEEWMRVGSLLTEGLSSGARISDLPRGAVKRFAARAAEEGVPQKRRAAPRISGLALANLAAAMVAALLLFPFGKWQWWSRPAESPAGSGRQADVRDAAAGTLATSSGKDLVGQALGGDGTGLIRTRHRELRRRSGQSRSVEAGAPRQDAAIRTDAAFSPRFLMPRSTPACESEVAPASWQTASRGETDDRRVFCYNPRIASLTSLDLYHAAASNTPFFRADLAGFRLSAAGDEATRP